MTSIEHSDGRQEHFKYGLLGGLVEATNEGAVVRLERDLVGRVIREYHGEDWVESIWGSSDQRRELRTSLGFRLAYGHGLHGLRSLTVNSSSASEKTWRMYFAEEKKGHLKIFWASEEASQQESNSVEYNRDIYGVFGWLASLRWRTKALGEEASGVEADGLRRDAMGRVVERSAGDQGCWRYEYTVSGLLTNVVRPDGERVELQYDPFGRLISHRMDQAEMRWIWDGGRPLHEISSELPPTIWLFEPQGPAVFGKIQAGRRYSIATRRDAQELTLCDQDDRVCWIGAVNEQGKARVTHEETSWPWIEAGLYHDVVTGLRFGRTNHFEPTSGTWLVPPRSGLMAEIDRSWFSETYIPHSMLLTHRISAELLETFVSVLKTPSLPKATLPEVLLRNALPLPDAHPLLDVDPMTNTPLMTSASTLWHSRW